MVFLTGFVFHKNFVVVGLSQPDFSKKSNGTKHVPTVTWNGTCSGRKMERVLAELNETQERNGTVPLVRFIGFSSTLLEKLKKEPGRFEIRNFKTKKWVLMF